MLAPWAWLLLGTAAGQQAGRMYEDHPPVTIARCVGGGCTMEATSLTLDANSRWVHGVSCEGERCHNLGSCYSARGSAWNATVCQGAEGCAARCAVEGVNLDSYENTYGVALIPRGVELKFVPEMNSRLYMMSGDDSYRIFKLKNREFAFDVDVSGLPCGLNGAVYFVEMKADGGRSSSNTAGAKFGTGYCDAQCPRDIKFMDGKANVQRQGHCCAEMDVWEANSINEAFTVHPCSIQGPLVCTGTECGDAGEGEGHAGVCNKAGCSFHSSRMAARTFFGPGPDFAIDTAKPMTVVTQWLTSDGTDSGDLSEIRRIYLQSGRVVYNWNATLLSPTAGSAITDSFCGTQRSVFGGPDDFAMKGGLKSMGEALGRGVVLVLSLWHDEAGGSGWLDSAGGEHGAAKSGSAEGPCSQGRAAAQAGPKFQGASVKYTNFMHGEIGTALKYRFMKGDAAEKSQDTAPGPAEGVVSKRSRTGPLAEAAEAGLPSSRGVLALVPCAALAAALAALALRSRPASASAAAAAAASALLPGPGYSALLQPRAAV